ncbi:MAG: lactate racemase domain-containing protein [Candidatus Poribacteria bacterium]|nr:lactate racemase domain-containing protein [Candidatus Poribacteria bacterium]MDD9975033.1 lactate racemase domain-containing protein [Candidatus Poribacteria bacterium]
MNNIATVRSGAWYGDKELTLNFPTDWEVEMLDPKDAPTLSDTQIEQAFAEPIGTPRISELAKGKKSATIIVDDLSRPTPASRIIPYILRELTSAGVPKSEIRFVAGVGAHRPLTDEDIVKKVGADIAAAYEVTNHNFMSGDLRAFGNLENGMPVYLNPVVADADFKICLGGIYPHSSVGFSGGAKLIVPGIAGFTTMFYFHTFPPGRGPAVIEGQSDEPDRRDSAELAAGVLGLDVIANVVLNSHREICGLFVGDFIKAHRKGAHFAMDTYGTMIPETTRKETDLVIINCYPLDADAIQLDKALAALSYFENAYTIALYPASDSSCYHGLFDRIDYPRYLRQRAEQTPPEAPPQQIGRRGQLHVWSEHFFADDFYKEYPASLLFRDLEGLIQLFVEKLPEQAKVAVLPVGGIQVLT